MIPHSHPIAPTLARNRDEPTPHFVRLYLPFVEAMPRWRALLEATNQLLLARTWETVRQAASGLFCGVLGFDEDRVSLTRRLTGRSAIEDFEQIGSFDGFRVCVVRLTRSLSDTRWSNTATHYQPCFRLVPRALLISYEPGAGVIRLVYRQRHGQHEPRPRYRCVVGPWFERDAQENLLTICQRLDRCRPALDDDAESLGSRLQAALDCEAGALAAGWASRGTVPEGELPGLPLATATRELMQAFLHGEDWCWGLRGHLANLLPIPIKHEALWLDLVAFKQVGAPATPEECWKTARTREQRLTLELALRSWSTLEIVQRLTIPISVVVPDENGWFWIEGRPHRHVPKVGLDGQLLSRHTLPSWVDTPDEEDDAIDQTQEEDRYPLLTAEGAAVDTLIGRALERRLWLLMRTIRRKARDLDTPSQIRAWLMATVPPGEALQLLTPAAARALLTPVDLARPSRDLTDVVSSNGTFLGVPPAWACPDVSSALPPDRFAVVAGARLHPTGALALPVVGPSGARLTVINTSAFAVNPRLGAPVAAGDRRWWAHPGLANHAALDAGALESPDQLAAGGVWRAVDVVVSPEVRQPQLAPHLRTKPPRMRTALDVPKLSGVEEAPTLLVTVGQLVESGADWLKIPTRHLAQRSDDEDSALKEVLEDTLGDSLGAVLRGGLTDRLPWDMAVQVLAVGLEEVKRLGVTLAWRAWIEVVPVGGGWQVVGRDGRMVRVEQGWWPEDLPHTLDGETFEAGLPGLAGETPCLSGLDGELLEVQVVHGLSVVPDVPESREHDVIAAVDRLPRPSVRSMGERFGHTRLRWLADGAPASMVKALDAGTLHRQVLLWCAGLAGPPQSAPVEDIQAVPLTSKPEAVSGALSDLRWVAVCLCGAVRGAAYLGRICEQCDTVVAPFEEVIRLRRAVLPMAVLHPWARELAAALLGLLPEELAKLLTRHGPTSVLSACRAALTQPGSNGRARLGLSDGHPRRVDGQARRRLGQLIELVEATPEPTSLFGFLAVEQVGLPCLDLVKVGSTLDEVTPTGSRLMSAFARLHGAIWLVKQAQAIPGDPLTITAEVHLQDCVDNVFGAPDTTGHDSLAGLVRMVSPWSQHGRPPVTRAREPGSPQPQRAAWWAQRAARAQVVEHHAVELIGLLMNLPELSYTARNEVIRGVARDLLDEQRDLRGLLDLLDAELPTSLPNDWPSARAALAQRLDASLSGVALEAVITLLGGWWMGEPSADMPSGARWLPPDRAGPPKLQRRVPPLRHTLWRTWRGLRQVRPELSLAPFFGLELAMLPVQVADAPQLAHDPPIDRFEVTSEPIVAEPATPEPVAATPSNGTLGPAHDAREPEAELLRPPEIRPILSTLQQWLNNR